MEEAASIGIVTSKEDLLESVLRKVSRSFHKTLRVLPSPVRRQVSLAYLLARTSDTIADSAQAPMSARLAALRSFRGRVTFERSAPLDLTSLCNPEVPQSEQTLLLRVEESLSILGTFPAEDRQLIVDVLRTITMGQEKDLLRFAREDGGGDPPDDLAGVGRPAKQIRALVTPAELDEYTYMVAGCVGEFWTRICRLRLFPRAELDERALLEDGVHFGKGLQLVNILRDLPEDLRQGRCYLPSEQLDHLGLKPEDLLDAENYPRLKPLHHEWIDVAEQHLHAGWRYTNRLPWTQARVRPACAWPLMIGFETLRFVRNGNVLNSTRRLKVPRNHVRRMIAASVLLYPFPPVWRHLIRE